MVGKALNFLRKEVPVINEAALLLGIFTLGSQILAIVRDRLLAGWIGPGEVLDVYYASFEIPNLIFTLAASLVSVTILMPFFVERLNEQGHDKAKAFMSQIFSGFFLFIIGISILTYIFMPQLVRYVAPGFSSAALADLVQISRIMLLSPILLGFSNLFGTITQAFHKFVAFGLAPVLYNLGILLGIILFYPAFGLEGLAYGVIIGALLHFLIQWPVVVGQQMFPIFTWKIQWSVIGKIAAVSVPRTLTMALSKITFLVLVAMASTIAVGSISLLKLAQNLQTVPMALIGASFSVAAFPTLVHFYTNHKNQEFIRHIVQPFKQIIFWSFPVMALFIVLRAQIVRVILGSGEFSWTDTRLTAAALTLFVISVVAQSLILLLVRGYYAAGKTWRPFTVNLLASLATVAGAYGLMHWYTTSEAVRTFIESLLRVGSLPDTEMLMLPLAFSIGAILNCFVLWFLFRQEFMRGVQTHIGRTLLQSFTVSVLMGAVAYLGLNILDGWVNQSTTWGIFIQGFIAGILALLFGSVVFWIVKNEQFMSVYRSLRRKFWKREVTVSGQDEL